MEETYTIVIPDSDILAKVCGANDINLRFIESALGIPVYLRGNEISALCNSGNDSSIEVFKNIIERILSEAVAGEVPCRDMISAIVSDELAQSKEQHSIAECERCNFETCTSDFSDGCIRIRGGLKSVFPKSLNQARLVKSLRENEMVFAVGPAGSGKTYLVVAEALRLLLERRYKKLILTRPVVEAGESLGFLPGEIEQKLNPYLRPLLDAMENLIPREQLRKLTESEIIEIAPLAYMRGRTLQDSVVILDEAQNTTSEQMKMFLTRLGENSKAFITGDTTQIDLPKRVQSGLVQAVEILKGIDGIAIHQLDGNDIVRNPLVKKIIQAYENAERKE